MSKITKTIANDVALKIVEPIAVKIKETEKQIEEMVTEMYKLLIPKEVMTVYGKFPEYVRKTNSVLLSSHGFSRRGVSLTVKLPYDNPNTYSTPELPLTADQAKEIQKLETVKEKLVEKKNTTKIEIENSLLALSTYKRVQEQLPQAFQFLPSVSTGLMINLAPVNEKINCLVSSEKDKKCIDKL